MAHYRHATMGGMIEKRASPGSLSRLRVLRAFLDDVDGEHYGLELIRRSGVTAGSLYPILVVLEDEGWITGAWEDIDEAAAGRRRRRYYKLTKRGDGDARAVLTEMAGFLAPPAESRPVDRQPRARGLAPA
jgi:PadR family transcriptional regulator, regulatory protein PadR